MNLYRLRGIEKATLLGAALDFTKLTNVGLDSSTPADSIYVADSLGNKTIVPIIDFINQLQSWAGGKCGWVKPSWMPSTIATATHSALGADTIIDFGGGQTVSFTDFSTWANDVIYKCNDSSALTPTEIAVINLGGIGAGFAAWIWAMQKRDKVTGEKSFGWWSRLLISLGASSLGYAVTGLGVALTHKSPTATLKGIFSNTVPQKSVIPIDLMDNVPVFHKQRPRF